MGIRHGISAPSNLQHFMRSKPQMQSTSPGGEAFKLKASALDGCLVVFCGSKIGWLSLGEGGLFDLFVFVVGFFIVSEMVRLNTVG